MAHPSFSNKELEAREGVLNICEFTFTLIVALSLVYGAY
jgi:hypothetical protein